MDPRRSLAVLAATLMIIPAMVAGRAGAAPAALADEAAVPTRHGNLHAEFLRPQDDGKYPVLLTYSPYAAEGRLSGTSSAADALAQEYVGLGYVRVVADALGTGLSAGCWDWGGVKEQQAAYDLVTWAAEQPWSNGKVAVIGTGYDAGVANALVAQGHPSLATAISVSGVSSWYDYSYSQGTRRAFLSEDPTTSADSFNLIHSRVVSTNPAGAGWAAHIQQRVGCSAQEHLARSHDTTPDFDAYWKDRDYAALARANGARVQTPVLFAHGYQDSGNFTDQTPLAEHSINMFQAIPLDDPTTTDVEGAPYKRLILGQWGHGTPAWEDWDGTVRRWLQEFVQDADTGLTAEPMVASQHVHLAHGHGAEGMATGEMDEWSYGDTWPLEGSPVELFLRRRVEEQKLGTLQFTPSTAQLGDGPEIFVNTGKDAEEHTRHHPNLHEVEWLWYTTPTLKENVHIAGPITLELHFQTDNPDGQIHAVLVDFMAHELTEVPDPEHAVHPAIARGSLNVQYVNGLDQAKPTTPNTFYKARITLNAADYMVGAGRQIGLLLQGSNVTWFEPVGQGQFSYVVHGGSRRDSKLELNWLHPHDPAAAF